MFHEAATIAAEAGDVVRIAPAGATAKPDGLALLREPQAAGMGERGQSVQVFGRRGPGLARTDLFCT